MRFIKLYKLFQEYYKVQQLGMKVLCINNFNTVKMKKFILLLLLASFSGYSQIVVGERIPNIKLKGVTNQIFEVAAVDNKYVLIDFWASWCAPCRAANKKLIAIRNKYHSSDLEIIGISLDTDKNKWLSAIEKDKINYTQLNDPNGFDAPTALQFGVDQLPATYLFDKNGKLIAINPTLENISNKLNLK